MSNQLNIETEYIEIDEVYLFVNKVINPINNKDPPLIFLHSFTTYSDMYFDFFRELFVKGLERDVVAINMYGHGLTEGPRNSMWVEVTTNLVSKYLISKDLNDVVLMGHSLGAITTSVIMCNKDVNDRIAKVLLYAGFWGVPTSSNVGSSIERVSLYALRIVYNLPNFILRIMDYILSFIPTTFVLSSPLNASRAIQTRKEYLMRRLLESGLIYSTIPIPHILKAFLGLIMFYPIYRISTPTLSTTFYTPRPIIWSDMRIVSCWWIELVRLIPTLMFRLFIQKKVRMYPI